jgi:epoxyqueuosine reductase
MRNSTTAIKDLALTSADLVGIAPADRLAGAPAGHRPEDVLPGARSVIVVGFQWIQALIDQLPASRPFYTRYMGVMRDVCDRLTYQISAALQKQGYRAFPIPNSDPYDTQKLVGILSLKHAAVAAGLGQFGLNNLLITPQFGPRLRFGAVVTNAGLDPDPLCASNLCVLYQPICHQACIRLCPAQALPGHDQLDPTFKSAGIAIDKAACNAYQEGVLGKPGQPSLANRCGMCIHNCPIGRPAVD